MRRTPQERRLRRALAALCVTQVVSWGVLYYAFPVMVVQVAADTGWGTGPAMAAFSVGAVVNALAGVLVGPLLDRLGPRLVMSVGSVAGALGVVAVASAPTLPWFFAAWVVVGLGQAGTLYPPAFVALTRWFEPPRRVRALTVVTIAGGLASTVFAPTTAALTERLGWRPALLVLAAVALVVTLPLHAGLLTPPWRPGVDRARGQVTAEERAHARAVVRSRPFLLLTAGLALGTFGLYAATVNLVPLLTGRGLSTQLAAWGLGLVGAGQLVGRLGYGVLSRHTSIRTRTAGLLAGGGAVVVVLGLVPGPAGLLLALAVLAGALRGALTLVQATAVAERWGTTAFGRVNGLFGAPIMAVIALAPGAGALLAGALGGFPTAALVLGAGAVVAGVLVVLTGQDARRPLVESGDLRDLSGKPVRDRH